MLLGNSLDFPTFGGKIVMKKSELIEKLEDIEWEDFEVKEAKSEIPKSSWETVSAFSNTAGGWLIFGISKKGRSYDITGVSFYNYSS